MNKIIVVGENNKNNTELGNSIELRSDATNSTMLMTSCQTQPLPPPSKSTPSTSISQPQQHQHQQQQQSGPNNFGIVFNGSSNNSPVGVPAAYSASSAISATSTPLLLSPSSPQTASSSLLPSTFTPTPTFYSDDDDDNEEDTSKVIEDSPNGRWSKLKSEISSQKLLDFDSANLAIDSVLINTFFFNVLNVLNEISFLK